MKKLPDDLRIKVRQYLVISCLDTMFGDGLEKDYILDGMSFKGLNNMSDEELVDELRISAYEGDDDEACDCEACQLLKVVKKSLVDV